MKRYGKITLLLALLTATLLLVRSRDGWPGSGTGTPSATKHGTASSEASAVESPGSGEDAALPSKARPRPEMLHLSPGVTPGETAATLWGDQAFLDHRNGFQEELVRHTLDCLTPELVTHLRTFQRELAAWVAAHPRVVPPVDIGPVFSAGCGEDESADLYEVGQAVIDGDRAEVPTTFTCTFYEKPSSWSVTMMLVKRDGHWLLDDVKFPEDTTLRGRSRMVQVQGQPDEEGRDQNR